MDTFFSELMAELKRRAQTAKETQGRDLWDEVNESLSMKGGIGNPHVGYGQMGDICMVI